MSRLLEYLRSGPAEPVAMEGGIDIVRQDKANDTLFYVLEGRLEALADQGKREIVLFDSNPGDLIGLFSFFAKPGIVLFTLRTVTPVKLLKISRQLDRELEARYPDYRMEILSLALNTLRERLRDLTTLHVRAQEATEKLVLQEKMATVGRLSAVLAHELNNNVSVIAKGVEFCCHELPRVLEGHLSEEENYVFSRALDHGYQLTSREIRQAVDDLSVQKKYQSRDRSQLTWAVEIQNRDEGISLDRLLAMSPDALKDLHTLSRLGARFRNMIFAGEQISHMVRNFKTLSRPPSTLRRVPLSETVEHAVQLLMDQLEGVRVHYQLEMDEPVLCRPEDLVQLWSNLISNAVDAMQGSGEITFTLRREGDNALVTVRDTGPGFPPGIAEQMFQPHMTTKLGSRTVGMGLGLTICRQIAATHQGAIQVCRSDQGGCIQVTLPIRRKQE